jgi:hypothetical protein
VGLCKGDGGADEDIGGWSARIEDCLVRCGGSMGFWSIVTATKLVPVYVLLGFLLEGVID